jgi:hypothetical protein
MCPSAYVNTCYRVANELGVRYLAQDIDHAQGGPFIYVFTGVDPAFTENDKSDFSAVFTFGIREDGIKVVLDLTQGKWPPPVLAQIVTNVVARFNSLVAVESNSGGEVLRSFMVSNDMRYPMKGLRTGSEKWSPEMGVATFFGEMEQGDWAFPYMKPQPVLLFAEDCTNYTPVRHTPDLLMAAFVARKFAKKWGVLNGKGERAKQRAVANSRRFAEQRRALEHRQSKGGSGAGFGGGGIAVSLMSR